MEIEDAKLKDYINNKKILVIGNSPRKELLTNNYFEDIDIIVRFNTGIEEGYADIWCAFGMFSTFRIKPYIKNDYKYAVQLQDFHNPIIPRLVLLPSYIRSLMQKELKADKIFSGTMFLYYLIYYCSPKEIQIIGFNSQRYENKVDVHTQYKHIDDLWIQQQLKKCNLIGL